METAEREYAETMEILEAKLNEVRALEAKLNDLNEKLDQEKEHQRKLEEEVQLCSDKLIRAKKLIGS